jgi:hypothetical protein
MKLLTAFKLGRISNLPTVWSNVLAGVALGGAGMAPLPVFSAVLAMSLVYTAGMFFNDAFDAAFDREHRPERPIPAGETDSTSVKTWAAAMMLAALLLLGLDVSFTAIESWYPLGAGLLLCALVLLYDRWHKANPCGPLIMGLCRGMVYITIALSMSPRFSPQLIIAAACLTAWVLGLSMVAKGKNVFAGFILLSAAANVVIFFAAGAALGWQASVMLSLLSVMLIYAFVYLCRNGKYWNPVTLLIAAISLVDAMVIVSVTGVFEGLALAAAAMFLVTLALQRFIEGS